MCRRDSWLGILAVGLAGALVAACASGGNTPPGDDDDDVPAIDAPPAGQCTPACQVGMDCCLIGGTNYCVNLASDNKNCGDCGVTCLAETGAVCSGATCRCGFEPACTGGRICCDTGCKDFDSDNNNCGGCGIPCGPGLTCTGGDCLCGGVECQPGESCCGGTCVNTSTSAAHCGGCDKPCAEPTSECNGGTCSCPGGGTPCPPSTGTGQVLACCGADCVDLCADGYNCGTCTVACPETIPGFPPTCLWGSCDGSSFLPECLGMPTP